MSLLTLKYVILIGAITFCVSQADKSASDLVLDIFNNCVSQYSTKCVKHKALNWLSEVSNKDEIKLLDELSIIKTSEDEFKGRGYSQNPYIDMYDRIDSFLTTHSLKVDRPKILEEESVRASIPENYLTGGLADGLIIPLTEGRAVEGNSCFEVISYKVLIF